MVCWQVKDRWNRLLVGLFVAGISAVLLPHRALGEDAARMPALATPDFDEPPSGAPMEAPTFVDAAALDARIAQSEQLVRNSQPTVTVGGYVDAGFFAPAGDGSGYREDFGNLWFPEYGQGGSRPFRWVFAGDILAPAVNSRGEVADLGTAPGVDRFDSVNSRGAPGFILNEVNLALRSALTPTALVNVSVNFTPRTGNNFALGDSFDVDIAQLEWLPTESQRTSIFVGKIDSVLGIEYRERKSDRRFGITPSLMSRYTTGPALGVKVRTKFGTNDWLVLAVAATNGSNTTEQFHFYDEVDSNSGKTLAGRLAVMLPFSTELGFSGSYGPQDRATNNGYPMWFFGPDLLGHYGAVDLKAEWLKGHASGDASGSVYGLNLHGGGYVEVDAMVSPSWGILGRAEYRDAFVWLGSERAYVTESWRATGGVRWVVATRALIKAEYLYNGEFGRVPHVPNNVFTSSLVLSL